MLCLVMVAILKLKITSHKKHLCFYQPFHAIKCLEVLSWTFKCLHIAALSKKYVYVYVEW